MDENSLQDHRFSMPLAARLIASGLVSEDALGLAIERAKGDGGDLERLLLENGLLTRFQMEAINEGRQETLRVGNYDILDRLGAGGMGTVFKARHRRMKRIVALKVLSSNLSGNPLFVKRFQREVETIAALGHPNVVMAYDADEAEVGHFLVMEFVNGPDLAACVERDGPFSTKKAVTCVLQAARGLAYAHSQGIVHRDVKPHNLLLDVGDVVKVTDLGLARLNFGSEGPAPGSDVTMAGGVIGTADYMPPEQAIDSTTIDHRADIYSLGCTLYYLLTGRPPFGGPTLMSILLKHREAEIPQLSAVGGSHPQLLEDLFRSMLAKQPEQRRQSMSEVVNVLEEIATGLSPDAPFHATTGNTSGAPALTQFSNALVSTSIINDCTLALDSGLTTITVLIVEPSRVQTSIMKNYLEEHGLSVVGTATKGSDAIQAVRSLRPRAVLIAMHLADMNGVELAHQIRSEIQVDAPGFVLVASESEDGSSAALSKLNRVLLLQKPFSAAQLAEALGRVTGSAPALQPTGLDRRQLRVLIVDDSRTARLRVRTVLEELGFSQFIEVPDGADAIAVAAREICHLIVTDYNMPLMDGRALVSYLKQNPSTSNVPVLMVTTETEPRVLDPVRQLGVVAIVEKAFPASIVGPLLDKLF